MSYLGGGVNGYSAKQTITNYKDGESTMTRKILRDSWNTRYARGSVNGYNRAIGPFRAINNLGDFLSRQNYVCGGSNQINKTFPGGRQGPMGSIISQCDNTGVPASVCNPRYVPDSSDYTRYKKQHAINRTYNDIGFGGDNNNGSYVSLMAVRRR
jgi:hypothetical protein